MSAVVSTAVRRNVRPRLGPFVPRPRGRLVAREESEWLVHTRRLGTSADRVWAAVTRPEQLGRWVGTWQRLGDDDPGDRGPLLRFGGDDLLPAVYRLDAYAAGRGFTVSLRDPGARDVSEVRVEVAVRDDPDGSSPTSESAAVLTLAHSVTNRALAPHLGAGCEYYLDRLQVLLEPGVAPGGPAATDVDDYFLAQAAYYRRLFPLG